MSWTSGDVINTQARLRRLSGAIPSDYTVFVDSGTYYAESNRPGGTDYSGADAKTILQNAIDGTTNGWVFVKGGAYPITGQLAFNSVNKIGMRLDPGARIYRSGSFSYHLIDIDDSTNVTIEGGILDGVSDDTTELANEYLSNNIHVEDSTNVLIRNVHMDNCSDDGIWIEDADKVSVIGCHVTDFYKHGISVYSPNLADKCNDVTITGNVVDGENGMLYDGITVYAYSTSGCSIVGNVVRNVDTGAADNSGIHVEDPSGTPDDNVIAITGNTAVACQYGITSSTSRPTTITGNAVHSCTTAGIFLNNPVDNVCSSNTVQDSAIGIYMVHGLNTAIIGNTITDSTGIGIHLHQTGGGAHNITIDNNVLENIGGDGIYLNATYGFSCCHNTLENIDLDGIETYDACRGSIADNSIVDAGQGTTNTYDGLKVGGGASSFWLDIHDNYIHSASATTMKYLIDLTATADNNRVCFNQLGTAGTATLIDGGSGNKMRHNKGYVNEAFGFATIPNAAATVDINPGFHASIDFTSVNPIAVLTGMHAEVSALYYAVKDADEITVTAADGVTSDNRVLAYHIMATNCLME